MKLFSTAGKVLLLAVGLIGLAFFGLISPILKIRK
jgi:hypothetical protein